MRYVARLLIALAFVVASAVLLLSLGGGVGVWAVRGPVTDKATRAFDKAGSALDKADRSLALVRQSLDNAATRLGAVRREQQELARQPRDGLKQRLLARTVQQTVTPLLGGAHEHLNDIAEAAVAVKGVIEVVAAAPLLADAGLDADGLLRVKGQLSGAAPAAWELSRLLNGSGPDAEIDAQCTRVEQLLRSGQELAAEYDSQLADVRQRVEGVRDKTLGWITPGAALISFACFWIALSQVSLLFHARSWWKRLGRPTP